MKVLVSSKISKSFLALVKRSTANKVRLSHSMSYYLVFLVLFLKDMLLYLKGRVTEGGRDRKNPHLLVHSPDGCDGQGYARLKPEAWNSILVSCMDGGDSVV